MNKRDRKDLQRAVSMLDEARSIVGVLSESEQDKFDNMPENLQDSERGEKFESDAAELQSGADAIESAMCELEELT